MPRFAPHPDRRPAVVTGASSGIGAATATALAAAGHPVGIEGPAPRSTRAAGWRLVVDRDLCQGHGVCEGEAPDLFQVSKAGQLTIVDDRPPHDARQRAEAAVTYCPTHALSLVDDQTDA